MALPHRRTHRSYRAPRVLLSFRTLSRQPWVQRLVRLVVSSLLSAAMQWLSRRGRC